MELQTSENYEELSREWQYQYICLVRDKLKKFGVSPLRSGAGYLQRWVLV